MVFIPVVFLRVKTEERIPSKVDCDVMSQSWRNTIIYQVGINPLQQLFNQ